MSIELHPLGSHGNKSKAALDATSVYSVAATVDQPPKTGSNLNLPSTSPASKQEQGLTLAPNANISHERLPLPQPSNSSAIRAQPNLTTDTLNNASASARTSKQNSRARLQFATLCWTFVLVGWNDASTGPLIPRIRVVYHVGFAIVSLIFVFACLGFISGSLANIYMNHKLGFGKTIFIGSIFQVIAYTIQSTAPPYPVFLLAYVIGGIGVSLHVAQGIGFVASFPTSSHPETKMGILQASYGLGAFAAPLVANQFAQLPLGASNRWAFHYLVSLAIAVSNSVFLFLVFEFKTQDECLTSSGQLVVDPSSRQTQTANSSFNQVLKTRTVHLMAFFILIYVGVEVTIGGWIVTFLMDQRGGGSSSGYTSSGFFGGLAIGRLLLLWVNKKIGEWRVLFLYTTISIGLEITIYLIPSLIENAIAVSLVGLLFGPMYPIAMNQCSRILPRWILTSSVGWIAGFGQAGSAVLPFLTGAIASKRGIGSLQPLIISMMSVMMAIWWFVPSAPRRPE